MNIIELATQRLHELSRAGVEISSDGINESRGDQRIGTVSASVQNTVQHNLPKQKKGSQLDEIYSDKGTQFNSQSQFKSQLVDLDIERLEETGVLVSTRSRSTMAEEFRHIKRPILANTRKASEISSNRRSLVMVTSALPGEGKTFCSINLALSMAVEVDMSVLLVDADVVRCNLMRTLGLQPRKGLLDVLTDPQLELSEVLLKTNIPKLSLLPAGTCNVRSTELLASDAMDKLLEELACRYSDRIVIFDTTPLLLTSEAKVLASHMGQVVVVVEESKTSCQALQEAFAAVEACPVVMSILNKGHKSGPDYGSYYG